MIKAGFYLQALTLTCYTSGGDLHCYQTGERIRRATKQEIELSNQGDPDTGAFSWSVSRLTIKRRCPNMWTWINRQ